MEWVVISCSKEYTMHLCTCRCYGGKKKSVFLRISSDVEDFPCVTLVASHWLFLCGAKKSDSHLEKSEGKSVETAIFNNIIKKKKKKEGNNGIKFNSMLCGSEGKASAWWEKRV